MSLRLLEESERETGARDNLALTCVDGNKGASTDTNVDTDRPRFLPRLRGSAQDP